MMDNKKYTPEDLVFDLTGERVVVNVYDIEKLNEAEDIPYTLYLFDKGTEWFAHLRLNTESSHSHSDNMEDAIKSVFTNNKEYHGK